MNGSSLSIDVVLISPAVALKGSLPISLEVHWLRGGTVGGAVGGPPGKPETKPLVITG